MSRSIFAGLLILAIILIGLVMMRGEVIALSIPLILYLVAGYYWGVESPQLEIIRTIDNERISPGETSRITLCVRNLGQHLENVLLEDVLPVGLTLVDGSQRRLVSLKPNTQITWQYAVKGRRGFYPLIGLRTIASDPLGLVERIDHHPTRGQLSILPVAPRIRRIAIRPRMTRVYAGTIPARVGGPGIEFFGVREYHPGDSQHWINWRASARYSNALYSNEFEQERVADVGIILDGRRKINELGSGHSIFDQSVLAATSLADGFISGGNRVGLLVYGKQIQWIYPGYGKYQREKILQSLARADLGENDIFSELIIPKRLFPPLSQMVLVSPLDAGDFDSLIGFRSAGYQLIVVSPDPVAYEINTLGDSPAVSLAGRIIRIEREILLHRLQRAGVQVVNWDTSVPFDNAVQPLLSRPPAWLRAIHSGSGMR